MNSKFEKIDRIIEYGIYAYIFFTFLAKGEGIRNILLYGGFGLWLFTLRYRDNLHFLKEPVFKLCCIYLITVLVSVIFSIEPLYSLTELWGPRDNPLKFAFFLPVIATVISDENKLKRVALVSLFSLVFIVTTAYYSYIYHDLEMLKPYTTLVHTWHGRFGRYLCLLMPISFTLYVVWKKQSLKIVLGLCLVLSVFALILSTSRTGYAAFIIIVVTWSLYLARKAGVNGKKIAAAVIGVFIICGILAYHYVPDTRKRINTSGNDIYDLNERTEIWRSAYYAILQRPVIGWGYGDSLFQREAPYKLTPYKKPPVKGPHNIFIEIMFHQGIVGVIPYILLLLTSVVSFWKGALNSSGIKSYILAACVSILIGNFIMQNMLSFSELNHLAVVLGLGLAAKGINENSLN